MRGCFENSSHPSPVASRRQTSKTSKKRRGFGVLEVFAVQKADTELNCSHPYAQFSCVSGWAIEPMSDCFENTVAGLKSQVAGPKTRDLKLKTCNLRLEKCDAWHFHAPSGRHGRVKNCSENGHGPEHARLAACSTKAASEKWNQKATLDVYRLTAISV